MKPIFLKIILFLFGSYWILTILYVSPDNFIRISLIDENQTLNTFLAQRWEFFAPPPTYNDRLYYYFKSKQDTSKYQMFEAIQPIQKLKSNRAPFNSSEDILDYVISNSLHTLNGVLVDYNKNINYRIETNELANFDDKDIVEMSKVYIQNTQSFQTLKNYSTYIARKNNLNKEIYEVQLIYATVPIPRFSNRNLLNEDLIDNEVLIFKSDFFHLTP